MSFWNYRGRCIGRVIHFLYHYAGMDVAEHARIGVDSVEYRGKPFARYKWSDTIGLCDVPEFDFVADPDGRLANAQRLKGAEALEEACACSVPEHDRLPVDNRVAYVMNRQAYSDATIYIGMLHGAEPSFFVRDSRFYAEASGWIYAWDAEAKNWMLWVKGDRGTRSGAANTAALVQQ